MPSNSRNVPNEVTQAIKAANSVEKSQSAHHLALVRLIVMVASMAIDEALEILNLYTADRHARNNRMP